MIKPPENTQNLTLTHLSPPCELHAKASIEPTGELKTFDEIYQEWLKFKCDGTCNNKSDVCCHYFTWKCPSCGKPRTTIGECMPDVKEINEGDCDDCFMGYETEAEQD